MERFIWNALKAGDRVGVHDDADEFTIHTGTVAIVRSRPLSNDVAIAVEHGSGRVSVERPRRNAVHTLARSPHEACWRCDVLDGTLTAVSEPRPV